MQQSDIRLSQLYLQEGLEGFTYRKINQSLMSDKNLYNSCFATDLFFQSF